ncbi:cbb3-type cytochrome oxidase assembly protein CcoS [Aquirufa sp. OSTEICH-129V]|uniref:Cbb3-type cytochrome oxidase assembly protein CcoS n=1 Tax=Aquirufa avitistagni TaxID=3104728 RepID=A0ABW6DFE4_9BACT
MEIIYVMIALSLLMAVGFLLAFVWSVKNGQQDDLITPAMRILTEEKTNKPL